MFEKKFQIQNSLYEFPYHNIPHFTQNGTPSLIRNLSWGFDYLCYQKHLNEKIVSMHPDSVLEVGCGDGYFIGNLPSSITKRVGVDLSSKAIAFAKAFHPDCIFFHQNVDKITGKFDIVAAIEVIEHIPDDSLSAFFKSLYALTNEKGKIIISVPTMIIPLNKKHYRHYTIDLLNDQLTKSQVPLKINEYEYIYSDPVWLKHLRRLQGNRFFCLEIKPLMMWAWKQIWNHHRIANKKTGFHLVAVLETREI